MIKKIDSFLFGNIPFSCESKYSPKKSVALLKEATEKFESDNYSKQKIIGEITTSRVCLHLKTPAIYDSFNKAFSGKFEEKEEKTYLNGKFTILPHIKILAIIPLGIALSLTFYDVSNLVFFIGGILFIKLGSKTSAKNIDRIKKIVTETLIH